MEEATIYRDTIYRVLHGSRAYGTHRPDSDRDEKGVCILRDPRYYYGFHRFEQKDKGWEDGNDRVIYDIRKFVALALDCNPNIIEMLYADEQDILHIDELGSILRKSRDLFLTQRAARTFVGYAVSQLHRIRGHYSWLQNPPELPVAEDYLHEHTLLSDGVSDQQTWEREFDNHVIRVISGKARIEHHDKGAFKTANKKYKQYTDWRQKRNPDRAAIEAEYGYDCKHAYHLIRLLRMGKEILTDGTVQVKRSDAAELLDIRNGKFKYDELVAYAEELKIEVNQAQEKSPLPKNPDADEAEKLLMILVEARLQS